MADISDVTKYLYQVANTAVYPNGTSLPSITGMAVRIFEGWPNPDLLDRDMAGKMLQGSPTPIIVPRPGGPVAEVSVFPMLGAVMTPYQIQDKTYTISNPIFGLTVSSVVNGVITVSGTPVAGEYLTVVTDRRHAYSRGGASLAAILTALAADAAVDYSGVNSTATTLTIPNTFSMVIRQGGTAVLGKVIHRQRQSVMVTVWAPDHDTRTTLAIAIDNAIKEQIVITLPDTSQAVVTYSRTNVIDDKQMQTIYRRDLIYEVEYATVQQFPGYVVTTVDTTIANPDGTATAPAIT